MFPGYNPETPKLIKQRGCKLSRLRPGEREKRRNRRQSSHSNHIFIDFMKPSNIRGRMKKKLADDGRCSGFRGGVGGEGKKEKTRTNTLRGTTKREHHLLRPFSFGPPACQNLPLSTKINEYRLVSVTPEVRILLKGAKLRKGGLYKRFL